MINAKRFLAAGVCAGMLLLPQLAGTDPIHDAAKASDVEQVRQIIETCVDVNARDEEGSTALTYAAWLGNAEIVKLLLDADADLSEGVFTALNVAALAGRTEIVRILLDAGADVNATDMSSWPALMSAAMEGHNDIVKLLIESGADVNEGNDDRTALMESACRGHAETVRLLIDARADVNAIDRDAVTATALMGAACFGRTAVVKILLNAGADSSVRNMYGDTALTLAIKEKNRDIEYMLRRYDFMKHAVRGTTGSRDRIN
jgi:ankyrin repeat protein